VYQAKKNYFAVGGAWRSPKQRHSKIQV
jgi:hypothetical protein